MAGSRPDTSEAPAALEARLRLATCSPSPIAPQERWRKFCEAAATQALAGDAKAREWLTGSLIEAPTGNRLHQAVFAGYRGRVTIDGEGNAIHTYCADDELLDLLETRCVLMFPDTEPQR
jgi:hypothetical protein